MLSALSIVIALIVLLYSARTLYLNLTEVHQYPDVDLSGLADMRPSPLRRILKVLDINLEPLFFVAGIVLTATAVCLAFLAVCPTRPGLAALAVMPSVTPWKNSFCRCRTSFSRTCFSGGPIASSMPWWMCWT